MKTYIVFFLLLITYPLYSQVGIGTNTPNSSAALEVSSTTKGILLPRLSTTERDLISSPTAGLFIYNTTSKSVNFYNGIKWQEYDNSLATFNCSGQSSAGILYPDTSASSVTINLPYVLGNGSTYSSSAFSSSGVTGLTATLPSGTLANGAGVLTFQITGIPASIGVAIFTVNLFGQTCNLEIEVSSICGDSGGLGLNDLNGGVFTIDGDTVNTTTSGTSGFIINATNSVTKCDVTTGDSFYYSIPGNATIVINFDVAVNNVKLIGANLDQNVNVTIATDAGSLSVNNYVNNCPTDFIITGNILTTSPLSFPNAVVDIESTVAYNQITLTITNLVTNNNYFGLCFENALTP